MSTTVVSATEPSSATAAYGARPRAPRLVMLAAAFAALLVLLPLAFTVWRAASFGFDNAVDLVFRPLVGELLANTLLITVTATLAAAVVGTAAAWFVERTMLPARRVWGVLMVAPLAMPPFIASYAWVSLSLDLQDFLGALLVVTSTYFPLVYLPVAAALRGMDLALEETARSLGCGRFATFARVVLPQLRPALLGGMLLVALNVMSEFGAFSLLRFRTFTTEIYAEYRTSFDGSGAALLACLLIALCLVCVALEFRVRGKASYARVDRGTRRAVQRDPLRGWRWLVAACLAILSIVTIGVPLGMIGYWLTQHGDAAITPVDVSLQSLFDAASASIGFGMTAALVTTALALPLSFLLVRFPGRLAIVLERIVFVAQGVPGLVIALALVSLAVRALRPLYQTTALLIIAYAILCLPLALVSVRAALAQVSPRLEETARSLGLGWIGMVRRVLFPLTSPGLGAAATMVFITVSTELNATLLLSPLDTHTLATQVWSDTSTLAFAAAAPYAALLVTTSLGASAFLFLTLGRSALRVAAGDQ